MGILVAILCSAAARMAGTTPGIACATTRAGAALNSDGCQLLHSQWLSYVP